MRVCCRQCPSLPFHKFLYLPRALSSGALDTSFSTRGLISDAIHGSFIM